MDGPDDGSAQEPTDAVSWQLRALNRDIAAAREELDSIIEATRRRRERWGEANDVEADDTEEDRTG